MIDKHLDQLRTTLEQAEGLPESTRTKLLELLSAVQDETADGAASETPAADSNGPAVTGLLASVEQLEASHPEIAGLINQVAITLSRMGI
ncbi:MAG: hypothetical protein JWO94_3145 [Verrucomicrobiaceae bacterium]|nr:hypothetical protein [Verrucomicrobiaceae bacterium]